MSQVTWNIGVSSKPQVSVPPAEPEQPVSKSGKNLKIVTLSLVRDPQWDARDKERGVAIYNPRAKRNAKR